MHLRSNTQHHKETSMFSTILVPTDGSETMSAPLQAAIQQAKLTNGKIVALAVAESFPFNPLADNPPSGDIEKFDKHQKDLAELNLKEVKSLAEKAGVACELICITSDAPALKIVEVAEQQKCDAIFMASHRRKGLMQMFIGSQTQKVLAHATVPVTVFR